MASYLIPVRQHRSGRQNEGQFETAVDRLIRQEAHQVIAEDRFAGKVSSCESTHAVLTGFRKSPANPLQPRWIRLAPNTGKK